MFMKDGTLSTTETAVFTAVFLQYDAEAAIKVIGQTLRLLSQL
jgi:hypothetical protein